MNNGYFDTEHYYPDGCPKKCKHCGDTDVESKVVAIDGGYVSEASLYCERCSTLIGYWAYGNYDPCFANLHPTEGP